MALLAAAPAPPPYAFRLAGWGTYGAASELVWLDGAPPLRLHTRVSPPVRSPDRRFAAFGDEEQGRVIVVDLSARRVVRDIRFPAPEYNCAADPLAWDERGRMPISLWCGDAHRTGVSQLGLGDPVKGTLLWRRPVGVLLETVRLRHGVLLLSSPPPLERLGPARVIRLGADGSFAQVVLRRVHAGYANARTFNRTPALAVDPDGTRAVVVSEGEPAAEIDLQTLRVRYRAVAHGFDARPIRFASRPTPHMGTTNPSRDLEREACWAGGGRIAVTGYDTWTHRGYDRTLAAGFRLLDTRTWIVRTIDPRTRFVRCGARSVIAWGTGKTGLAVYTPGGRLRFRRFAGRTVWVHPIVTRRVRVDVGRRHVTVALP